MSQLQYLYGNPVKKPKHHVKKHRAHAKHNPLTTKEIAELRKELVSASKKKAEKKSEKKEAKAKVSKPITKKTTTKSKVQGEEQMAKKKAKKVAKKAKSHKKVAKKAVKKVAKKAHKRVAKKVAKKKVAKVAKKAVRKVARKAKRSARRVKHQFKVVGGVAVRNRKKKVIKRHDSKSKYVKASHTKLPKVADRLRKGETLKLSEVKVRKVKTKKGKKMVRKMYDVKIKRTNPIVQTNPRKKRRNPIVKSNPRFMKNPVGAVGSSIVNMENKLLQSGAFKSVDGMAKKFLNAGVLEIAGLAVGSAFDGKIVEGVDWVASKVGASALMAKIPAQYKAPAITGGTGLLLHALNSFLAKKSGKKSQVLDELSKGLIASALVKTVAHMSKWSVENSVGMTSSANAMAGLVYDPSMGAFVHANPSASLPTGNSDFSGADFEGADFEGADFEGYNGYVQTMGAELESEVENMEDESEAVSMNGNW
jgi:hypothetical protein